MYREGLVLTSKGKYRISKKGVEFLHTNFILLREFVENGIRNLSLVKICTALARTTIRKNDRVGLFMENGILVAYTNKPSSSNGIAIGAARPGEEVGVKELEGIVALSIGKLWIIELPSIELGGSKEANINKIKKIYTKFKPDKLSVMDLVSVVLAKKLKLKYDFDYAPIEASIEAVRRGLKVLVFGTAENVRKLVLRIEEINANAIDKISYKLFPYSKKK
jgi:putative transcriptional regulator